MTERALTKAQRRIMEIISESDDGIAIRTHSWSPQALTALQCRNLVQRGTVEYRTAWRDGLVTEYTYHPLHDTERWRITPAGRAALQKENNDGQP